MHRIFLFVVLSLSGVANAEDLKLSKYPKVFKGDEGVTVTVVPVMPESTNQALVQVTGIDDDLDGKVFMHKIQDQGQDRAMVITVDGSERTRLRTESSYWWKQFNLYLPNKTGATALYYDEQLSKKANGAVLLKQYNKTDKALQAKLAKFNRRAAEKRHNEELAKMDDSAAKSCGTPLKTTIKWATIKDDALQEYSIHSYCGRVVDNLDSLCRNDAKLKPSVKKAVERVECQFGAKTKLTRSGKTISWHVEPDSPNQDDFVSAYLKNEL